MKTDEDIARDAGRREELRWVLAHKETGLLLGRAIRARLAELTEGKPMTAEREPVRVGLKDRDDGEPCEHVWVRYLAEGDPELATVVWCRDCGVHRAAIRARGGRR